MSVVSALHRVLVGVLIALPGPSSRRLPHGKGDGDLWYMLMCKKCAQPVDVGPNMSPNGITQGCPDGHVTTTNWRETTDLLSGKPCPQCGQILFDRGSAPPRTCDGKGGHQPAPVRRLDPEKWR